MSLEMRFGKPISYKIVPAYTYTATAFAVIHCGAKVIFVDRQRGSFEMDYDKAAAAITERTKAVVAVDLGGIIADYDKLYAVAETKRALFKPKEAMILMQGFSRRLATHWCSQE